MAIPKHILSQNNPQGNSAIFVPWYRWEKWLKDFLPPIPQALYWWSYPGMYKQNGGKGARESSAWDPGRSKDKKMGLWDISKGEQKTSSPSSASLAKGSSRWDDWAQELNLPKYLLPSTQLSFPKKSLGWMDSIPFLPHREVMSITGRGETGPTPPSASIIMGTHP